MMPFYYFCYSFQILTNLPNCITHLAISSQKIAKENQFNKMVQGVLVLIFWGVVRYLCCFPTSQCVLYDVLNSTSFFIQYCSVQVQFIHGGRGVEREA